VLVLLEVGGRVMEEGLRERTTIRWPGLERMEVMRERPMPEDVPVTNQTAFSGRVGFGWAMLLASATPFFVMVFRYAIFSNDQGDKLIELNVLRVWVKI